MLRLVVLLLVLFVSWFSAVFAQGVPPSAEKVDSVEGGPDSWSFSYYHPYQRTGYSFFLSCYADGVRFFVGMEGNRLPIFEDFSVDFRVADNPPFSIDGFTATTGGVIEPWPNNAILESDDRGVLKKVARLLKELEQADRLSLLYFRVGDHVRYMPLNGKRSFMVMFDCPLLARYK